MCNPILKMRENLLFFISMVINGLKCIGVDIKLYTQGDVSKMEMD